MIKNKKPVAIYRLFFGLLGLGAVVTEIVVLVHRGTFVPTNFISFFTIQANLLASIILLTSAVVLFKNKQSRCDMWRGASTLYMAMTGIIFAILLSGLDANVLTAVPWDNTVLHYIMPIAVFIDWLLYPPKQPLAFKRTLFWLAYPLAYLTYTLIRGHYVQWYPYPFLNVSERGYSAVLVSSVGVAILVAGLAWLVAKRTNRRKT